jgi:hypothetical protein
MVLDVLASSLASQLPQFRRRFQNLCLYAKPCRSEPARDGGGSVNIDVAWKDAIASRLTPTGGGGSGTKNVGAGLPAMAVGPSTWCWMCWPHRWQASSHSFGGVLKILCWAQNPVGVSLLAMAVVQSILMLPGRTLSRAGSLLQGLWFGHENVWELACQRWRWGSRRGVGCAGLIAGKPAPTVLAVCSKNCAGRKVL